MQAVSRDLRMLWNALFLQHDAYEEMREDNNPFVEGLFILVILGLALALIGVVGATLEWASSPNLDDLQAAILSNMQRMQWWEASQQASPEFAQMFQQIWSGIWQAVSGFAPTPLGSLAGVITRPLGLIVNWLIFGLLAHGIARLLGGKGTLNQTLGTTALAAAPQMLNLFGAFPFVVVAGIGTWTMLCRYMAIRTTHELPWSRAVWATILPPLILGLIIAVISLAASFVFGATLAALFAGGQ
jgi:hypothetical protein